MRTVLLTVALISSAGIAMAQMQPCTSPTGRTANVTGSATLHVVPDRVSFTIGVETESANVADAFRLNSQKVNRVIEALKKKGVTSQQIQTSNFAITSRDPQGKKLGAYRVSNSVTVTRGTTKDIGDLLQAGVMAGANEAGSLQFFVANQQSVQLHGLELAFQDARVKAEKLASLSARSLGDVLCVSDSGMSRTFGFLSESITVTAEAPAIETGVEDLAFNVSVVFELK